MSERANPRVHGHRGVGTWAIVTFVLGAPISRQDGRLTVCAAAGGRACRRLG
ncbi:hypothetical protein ABZ412_08980 [Nocardia sp. NPDC005746]|uniref:hypothetical protein n=1 Tax=Nocardia sp. NPDC005746 TaxID=3157062 RepID=UPI0033C81366